MDMNNTAVCSLQGTANTGLGKDSDMEGLESSEVRQQHQHVVSMFINWELHFVRLKLIEASSFRIQLLMNANSCTCNKIRRMSKALLFTAQR